MGDTIRTPKYKEIKDNLKTKKGPKRPTKSQRNSEKKERGKKD